MGNFKIGDWVKNKYKTVKVKSFITLDKIDYIQDSENGLMPVWQAELWQPKEGEWCWFYDIITDDKNKTPYLNQFQRRVMGINEKYTFECKNNNLKAFTYCEPFIGELPSFIKDKQ